MLRFILNKYLITSVAFLIWISVIDKNNISNQYKLYQQNVELQRQKQYYLDEIRNDRRTTIELKTNLRNLEKFAREKYMMKKEDEDLFVIVKEQQE